MFHLFSQEIIFLITALLIAYDIVAYVYDGVDGTLSKVIWEWSKKYPIVPFLFGLLMGHLFW